MSTKQRREDLALQWACGLLFLGVALLPFSAWTAIWRDPQQRRAPAR